MKKHSKNRASRPKYVSNNQLTIDGFESPFDRKLNLENRWVKLSNALPWDDLVSIYRKHFSAKEMGRPDLNPRLVLGAIIIKHMCDLDDRETVEQISENIYMQYFLGYSSFSDTAPFDASLFVEFRKRLGLGQINALNEKILQTKLEIERKRSSKKDDDNHGGNLSITHKGSLIIDATACPQDIAFPTDLNLLNDSREKSEQLMAFEFSSLEVKPRNYREIARKDYPKTAQKKSKTRKDIRSSIRKQLAYLRRNIASIHKILDRCESIPFDKYQYKYWFVIQHLYEQQKKCMLIKITALKIESSAFISLMYDQLLEENQMQKLNLELKLMSHLSMDFLLDDHSWDAYNEGTRLQDCVEKYKKRYGYYPKEVLVDKIYCTRTNRAYLKEVEITLKAKPLGRPSKKALSNQVSPGERNAIEGIWSGKNCLWP